jgi:hypothetical protein
MNQRERIEADRKALLWKVDHYRLSYDEKGQLALLEHVLALEDRVATLERFAGINPTNGDDT